MTPRLSRNTARRQGGGSCGGRTAAVMNGHRRRPGSRRAARRPGAKKGGDTHTHIREGGGVRAPGGPRGRRSRPFLRKHSRSRSRAHPPEPPRPRVPAMGKRFACRRLFERRPPRELPPEVTLGTFRETLAGRPRNEAGSTPRPGHTSPACLSNSENYQPTLRGPTARTRDVPGGGRRLWAPQ